MDHTGTNQHYLEELSTTTDSNYMGNISDLISITTNNLSRYGFICFHQPGECELINGSWMRKAVINICGKNADIVQKFNLPEEYCIELLPGQKIIESDNYSIVTSTTSQETIDLLLQRAGWNQTVADLESMADHGQGSIFIANYDFLNEKLPLGSGVSLPVSKEHGWIGMILVHPELRRQGIARSIMNSCIKDARLIQKKSIIGLDATPLGKQVYDSLGFRDSFAIWRSVIDTSCGKAFQDLKIIPFNFALVKNYLQKIDYTERIEIIEILASLPNAKNFMFSDGDVILGFVLSRPGRLKPFIGPLIADTPEIAIDLLRFVLKKWNTSGYKDVFMDIPEHHLENSIFIKEGNFRDSDEDRISVKPARSFIRMYQLVSDNALVEKSNDLAMKKAQESHDKTAIFMKKEIAQIVPKMYGTAGPEWS